VVVEPDGGALVVGEAMVVGALAASGRVVGTVGLGAWVFALAGVVVSGVVVAVFPGVVVLAGVVVLVPVLLVVFEGRAEPSTAPRASRRTAVQVLASVDLHTVSVGSPGEAADVTAAVVAEAPPTATSPRSVTARSLTV